MIVTTGRDMYYQVAEGGEPYMIQILLAWNDIFEILIIKLL